MEQIERADVQRGRHCCFCVVGREPLGEVECSLAVEQASVDVGRANVTKRWSFKSSRELDHQPHGELATGPVRAAERVAIVVGQDKHGRSIILASRS